jgi:hypothetical protein
MESLVPSDTRFRFTLRGAFLAIAAVSVWLAAVAPWFREWNGEQRVAFLTICGATAFGAALMAAALYSKRVDAKRRAGVTRFRLTPTSTRRMWLVGIGAAIFVIGVSTAMGFYQAIYPESRAHGGAWVWSLLAAQNGAIAAMAALGIRWRTTQFELCDGGILTGFGIQPWNSVRGFRWRNSDSNQLVLQFRWNVVVVGVQINAHDKPAVEKFLSERIAQYLG